MNAPLPAGLAKTSGAVVDHGDGGDAARTRSLRPPRSHRRRRRGQREADKVLHNHATDRWMVSYADFITLLFAFFVVMYAMSSVNEGRYRVLSGALSTAFAPGQDHGPLHPPPGPSTVPTGAAQTGTVAGVATAVASAAAPSSGPSSDPSTAAPPEIAQPAKPTPDDASTNPPVDPAERAEIAKTAERVQRMQRLATRVDSKLQALVRDGQVQVTRGARGIAIEINAAVLFDPAHAELKPASFDALRSLADVLSSFVEPLQIEGHSDDVPIATREFRSNWELSAARAASVGRFLIAQGVAPARIGIAGYAEFRPLVGNENGVSRARNRRVTLVVLSADDPRPQAAPAGDGAAAAGTAPATE